MKRPAVLAVWLLALAGCARSEIDRDRLAASGSIEESAPVKAVAEIVIAAPASRIFGLLTNVDAWPIWQADIAKAKIHGSPAVGAEFDWSPGSLEIHSTIRLLDPGKAICWTGRMLHLHAVHCWTLSAFPDDAVLVRTQESMAGWLIERMYSSADLVRSDQRWLAQLKQAAER